MACTIEPLAVRILLVRGAFSLLAGLPGCSGMAAGLELTHPIFEPIGRPKAVQTAFVSTETYAEDKGGYKL